MRAFIISALFVATSLTPVTASAMTYEEAAAQGVSPVTGSEMLSCALYWDAWARSLNPNHHGEGKGIWDAGWISTLNEAVQLPAAQDTSDYWFERAKADYETYDEMDAFYTGIQNAYDYDIESLDERKFMQFLGECARPAQS
jgi:hypothetical protein